MWPFHQKQEASRATTGPARVYAVGDVHGRLDLLQILLRQIEDDAIATAAGNTFLILLGDYVDRGPQSREVIELLASYRPPLMRVYCLKGNHEQALTRFLDDPVGGEAWAVNGGRETMLSYGVIPPPAGLPEAEAASAWEAARLELGEALPPSHRAFLQALQLWVTIGDYLFVHAGVRPGAPLDQQSEHDLLWIRKDFLEARKASDKVIVHGHTPENEPFLGRWRIGIDTGAYATGLLSAVRLEGTEQIILQARLSQDSSLPGPPLNGPLREPARQAPPKKQSMSAG